MGIYFSKYICGICLEKIRKFDKKYITNCNHIFHFKCMKNWLYYENKKTCPQCRNKEEWENSNIFLNISGY